MDRSITVIIPTYNRADVLFETLRSVFDQSVVVEELLLVDDGSTDGTINEVERFRASYPAWSLGLKYIYQNNQGKSAAINNAMKQVRTTWIAFNDSDDFWLPGKLEKQFETLEQYLNCGVCFCNAKHSHSDPVWGKNLEFDDEDLGTGEYQGVLADPIEVAAKTRFIRMQTMVVRRSLLEQMGDFDVRLRVAQDLDLVFRLSVLTDFCFINDTFVLMERDPNIQGRLTSVNPMGSLKRLLAHEIMYSKWIAILGENRPETRRYLEKVLLNKQSHLCNLLLECGRIGEAKSLLFKAFRQSKDIKIAVKYLLCLFLPGVITKRIRSKRD